jgi:transcriptional regulator with XRE-family HTH domain
MCIMGRKPARRAEPNGPELLKTWRVAEGLKQQEAAEIIGIDLARYNAFEHERARPGLDWADRIEAVTKGAVPMTSWAKDPKALAS